MNQTIFWLCAAGYNIITDIYIVLIPIPELIKLKLSTKKKLMLIAIFSTGLMYVLTCYSKLHRSLTTSLVQSLCLSFACGLSLNTDTAPTLSMTTCSVVSSPLSSLTWVLLLCACPLSAASWPALYHPGAQATDRNNIADTKMVHQTVVSVSVDAARRPTLSAEAFSKPTF